MSAVLTKTSILAGALYGYTPQQRKSHTDILKFTAIVSPLAMLKSWASGPPNVIHPVTTVIAAPIIIGWTFCIGIYVGKFARNALCNEEDS